MDAGGDTPSFHRPIKHLADTLLPPAIRKGWDLGNFAGYAPYQFYFLPRHADRHRCRGSACRSSWPSSW
jgi:hypothetical protein